MTYYKLEDYQAALSDFTQANNLDPDADLPVYNIACSYALMLQVELACHWLRRAVIMNRNLLEWVKRDSDFDGIRVQPALQALLQELAEI